MFKDRVIVITGSANGLGFGIARRFGQDGAQVVFADLNSAVGEHAAALLRQQGIQAVFSTLDVRDPSQSAALVDKLTSGIRSSRRMD